MRPRTLVPLVAGMLMAMVLLATADNYFRNGDLKAGSQAWRGDGKAAFLKPDGTEGSETDPGVIPVLRLSLSKGLAHSVFQEIHPQDAPGKLVIKVEVYASIDFKRSSRTTDYQAEDWAVPTNDFIVRLFPDYFQQTSDLKPGAWTKVEVPFSGMAAADNRAVYFLVPPGEGVIYIKNPSVTK